MKKKKRLLYNLGLRINILLFAVITVMGWSFTYGLAYFVDKMLHHAPADDTSEVVDYVIGISMSMMYVMFGILAIAIASVVRLHLNGLSHIADAAEAIANGDFDTPLPKIHQHTEVRMLRDSFVKMQNALKQYVMDLRNATEQKVSMQRDIEITAQIQQGMLPTNLEEREDIDVHGRLTPAKIVGGDLYDFFIRKASNDYGAIDDYLFFCVGDVSGKGVPASLLMSVTTHMVRNMSRRTTDTRRICNSINATIAERNNYNMFCTLFVGVLNLRTGRLNYCNAGHNPPAIVSDGKAEFMTPEVNIPIGVDKTTKYKSQTMYLSKGDILFLYTDGLNEAENVNKDLFGNEATLKAISAASNSTSMKVLTANVLATVNAFADGTVQSDDLTMVAIKRK